ncbi:MAG: hypothetical protein KDB23_22250, partial [Planctomycetales bacterium]|nr:hypothetical protein [Planctomycetales bacterium]
MKRRNRLTSARKRRQNRLQRQVSRRQMTLESCEPRIVLAGIPELIELNSVGAANPANFTQVGDVVYFTADDGVAGVELWKTDGTSANTVMVADIRDGAEGSEPAQLTAFNGQLYFVANDGTNGQELWKSDGTASGTLMVKDINPGEGYQYPYGTGSLQSFPRAMTEINGKLLLSAENSTEGGELWTTDGTASGTVLVKDIDSGTFTNSYGTYPNSSNPQGLTAVGGVLFFSATDSTNGRELWKSDGTAAGTVLVKDIFPGSSPYTYDGYDYGEQPNNGSPSFLTAVGGTLYFAADDG